MDRILEEIFLASIKGSHMIYKKKFGLDLKQFLFPVVLRLRGITLRYCTEKHRCTVQYSYLKI
jgi:hypothetical protein